MRVEIQIYGVTTPEDAVMCASLGADHVGVAVDEDGLAPDGVGPSEARGILASLPVGATGVALTLSRDADYVEYVAATVRPQILHIGADLESVGLDEVTRLKQRVPDIKVMRAIPVENRGAVSSAREVAAVADYLLLDTRDRQTGKIGATGHAHDWSVSADIVRVVQVPVVLAGGLSAANVADAIRVVRPWGVDSYSLTCADGDLRRKDPVKVRAFVTAVRDAQAP
jgi:phosphoribosylanthranilate isomerase